MRNERLPSKVQSLKSKFKKRQPWKILNSSGILLALWLSSSVASAEEQYPHHPMPLEQYIALLEDPKRDEWQKPDAVIQALNLKEGQVVADIGAGSGYFTLRLARMVGQKGRVLDFYKKDGIPVGPPMSMRLGEEMVKKELQEAGLKITEKLTFLPYQYILIAEPMTGGPAASPVTQQ